MDTRSPFEDPASAKAPATGSATGSATGWPRGAGSAPGPGAIDPIERRLNAIEDRLDAIEGSLRSEIARDLEVVSEEMRRAVSELGRLLLRDLGRLTKVLGEHRDEIVERLLPPPPPADPVGDVEAAFSDAGPIAPGEAPVSAPVESRALAGEEGRWKLPNRRRRRSPRPTPSGDTDDG